MKKPVMKILLLVLFVATTSAGYAADNPPTLPETNGYGDNAVARQKSSQAINAASQAARNGAVRAFPKIKVPSSGVDIGRLRPATTRQRRNRKTTIS